MIDVDFAVEKCMEILMESTTQFRSVDTDELGLFIRLTSTGSEPIPSDLDILCPKRIHSRGKPTVTGTCMERKAESRWSGWSKTTVFPSECMRRKMITHALGITLRTVLKNHIYIFDGTCYKQQKGGAIGVAVAGDVAVLFMRWWDKELLKRLAERGITTQYY